MNLEQIKSTLLERYPDGDKIALEEYISIVSVHDTDEFTDKHHILPRHCFREYECFDTHPWNMVKLNGKNHFIAHYWFAKIANSYKDWDAVEKMVVWKNNKTNVRQWSELDLQYFAPYVKEAKDHRKKIGKDEATIANMKSAQNRPDVVLKKRMSNTGKTRSAAAISNYIAAQNRPEVKMKVSAAVKAALSCPRVRSKLSTIAKDNKRVGGVWEMPLYNVLWEEYQKVVEYNRDSNKRNISLSSHCKKSNISVPVRLDCISKHFKNVVNGTDELIHKL